MNLKYLLFILGFPAIWSCQEHASSHRSATIAEACPSLAGKTFRYKPNDSLPDSLKFTIVFRCDSQQLKGVIFGPFPMGDEGLYFFREELDSLQCSGDSLSFSFVQHTYYERPFTLANYNRRWDNKVLGRGNGRQFYAGIYKRDELTLLCNSEDYSCYADTMEFVQK